MAEIISPPQWEHGTRGLGLALRRLRETLFVVPNGEQRRQRLLATAFREGSWQPIRFSKGKRRYYGRVYAPGRGGKVVVEISYRPPNLQIYRSLLRLEWGSEEAEILFYRQQPRPEVGYRLVLSAGEDEEALRLDEEKLRQAKVGPHLSWSLNTLAALLKGEVALAREGN